MKFIRSIRDAFARVTGRAPANDNSSLQFTVSKEQQVRALNPPTDNAVVEELHGQKVSDPFRLLEKLDAPETAAWLARQNKQFEDFVQPSAAVQAAAVSFLENAQPQ